MGVDCARLRLYGDAFRASPQFAHQSARSTSGEICGSIVDNDWGIPCWYRRNHSQGMKATTIITTFNHERFILQAVESAVSQQVNGGYEVVVFDDCSEDRTWAILEQLQATHRDRLRVHRSPVNECSNRRVAAAVRESSAEYVAFLDGDDFWTSSTKIQQQVDYLDAHRGSSLCFHNALIIQDDEAGGNRLARPESQLPTSHLADILGTNFIPSCSAVIRREALRDLPPWYDTAIFGDWPLYILASTHGDIAYLPISLGVYRLHPTGLWSTNSAREQTELIVRFLGEMNTCLGYKFDELIQTSIRRYSLDAAAAAEASGDLAAAARHARRGLTGAKAGAGTDLHSPAVSGRATSASLRRWLWLLEHPLAHAIVTRGVRVASTLQDQAIKTRDLAGHYARDWLGRPVGTITGNPNPVVVRSPLSLGVTTLSWTSRGTTSTEVRVGAPDGPLLSRAGPSGTASTGRWLADNTVFYLQDASGERRPSPANTLARVRVRLAVENRAT